MKALRLVLGASGHVVDAMVAHPEPAQLLAGGRPQVDQHLVASLRRHERARAGRAHASRPKDRGANGQSHISIDLKTTGTNARADGRNRALRSAEALGGGAQDTGHDTPPARMDGGDVSGFRMGDKHRDAVGHTNADDVELIGAAAGAPARDDRVRLGEPCVTRLDHKGSMNLRDARHRAMTELARERRVGDITF